MTSPVRDGRSGLWLTRDGADEVLAARIAQECRPSWLTVDHLERELIGEDELADFFRRLWLNEWAADSDEPERGELPRPPVLLDETPNRAIHAAESDNEPARALDPPAASQVPLRRPTGCNAPGSLGRHPIDVTADVPTSCPCGLVSRHPRKARP